MADSVDDLVEEELPGDGPEKTAGGEGEEMEEDIADDVIEEVAMSPADEPDDSAVDVADNASAAAPTPREHPLPLEGGGDEEAAAEGGGGGGEEGGGDDQAKAAVKIQSIARGKRDRQEVRRKREALGGETSNLEGGNVPEDTADGDGAAASEYGDEHAKAALMIQKRARGAAVRGRRGQKVTPCTRLSVDFAAI